MVGGEGSGVIDLWFRDGKRGYDNGFFDFLQRGGRRRECRVDLCFLNREGGEKNRVI